MRPVQANVPLEVAGERLAPSRRCEVEAAAEPAPFALATFVSCSLLIAFAHFLLSFFVEWQVSSHRVIYCLPNPPPLISDLPQKGLLHLVSLHR